MVDSLSFLDIMWTSISKIHLPFRMSFPDPFLRIVNHTCTIMRVSKVSIFHLILVTLYIWICCLPNWMASSLPAWTVPYFSGSWMTQQLLLHWFETLIAHSGPNTNLKQSEHLIWGGKCRAETTNWIWGQVDLFPPGSAWNRLCGQGPVFSPLWALVLPFAEWGIEYPLFSTSGVSVHKGAWYTADATWTSRCLASVLDSTPAPILPSWVAGHTPTQLGTSAFCSGEWGQCPPQRTVLRMKSSCACQAWHGDHVQEAVAVIVLPCIFKNLFIHERHGERERQRHKQREKQSPCSKPDVGLNSRTPGSCPEPKADGQLLSHPATPLFSLLPH